MVLNLEPKLAAALQEVASRRGIAPEELALNVLRERLLISPCSLPRDEWERGLIEAARPWGVAFSDAALSSEGIYE